MGLRVDVYRGTYDSPLNAFYGKRAVVVVNVSGPVEPNDERPAALLIRGQGGRKWTVVAAEKNEDTGEFRPIRVPSAPAPMFGGTFAGGGDQRWTEATGGQPVHIHDRYEPAGVDYGGY